MKVFVISYRTADNETGIARIRSMRETSPSRTEVRQEIPNFVTGTVIGIEPTYVLRYETEDGPESRTLSRQGVESVGKILMRRDAAWDIAVMDSDGNDVTFNFRCFA